MRKRYLLPGAAALVGVVALLSFRALSAPGSQPQPAPPPPRLETREVELAQLPPDVVWENLTISPDGQRVAYAATGVAGNRPLVIDGRTISGSSSIGEIHFSADSRHVSYDIRRLDRMGEAVSVDGREGPVYDRIGHHFLSPDGSRVGYTAYRGKQCVVVVDGVEQAQTEGTSDVFFSPDSRHVAFAAKEQDGARIFLDGRPGPRYEKIDLYGFSPDGAHLAARVSVDGEWHTFTGVLGKKGYDWLSVESFRPQDGEPVFMAWQGGTFLAVVEGKETPIYSPGKWPEDGFGHPVISPDGTRSAYAAPRDGKMPLVVEGKEQGDYDKVFPAGFSPDGRHTAWTVCDGSQYFLVVDDHYFPENGGGIPSEQLVAFSPDGKHVADVSTGGAGVTLLIDGGVAGQYDRFTLTGDRVIHFRDNNTLWAVMVRSDRVLRVEVAIGPGATATAGAAASQTPTMGGLALTRLSGAWGRAMLGVTWQVAALALLVWLGERLLRLRHSRVRYALWWLALAAPLLLAPARDWLGARGAGVTLTVSAPAAAPLTRVLSPAPAMAAPLAYTPAPAAPHRDPRELLFVTWAAGCGVLLLRLLAGHRQACRLLAASTRVTNREVHEVLRQLCRQARLTRPVAVRESGQVPSPVLCGWREPVILVPGDWLRDLAPEDLRALLAHEVAHVRRGDVVANLAQRLLEALLFFHPGAWLASRRITLLREEVCDAWALEGGASRSSYARSLMTAAQRAHGRLSAATVGVAEDRFTLLRRVEVIMKGEGTRGMSRTMLLFVTVAALAVAVAFTAVQLCGQEGAQGGGGNQPAEGGGSSGQVAGGNGGGWQGPGQPPGGNGGGGRHEAGGGGGDGRAAAPPPAQQFSLDQLDQKQLRHYQVGKRLADFPDKVDLSRPETTVAAIVRTMLRVDNVQWRRISPPRPERGGGAASLEPLSPENTRLYSGLTVQEVWMYQDRWAAVLSRFPQAGQKTEYNVRFVIHQGKQWLNLGEDVARDLPAARSDVARSLQWMERRPRVEAEALAQAWAHPEEYAAKAERVFDQLRRVDYAAYLARTDPDEWQPLPVDYTVSSDYPGWAEWVCKTFSRNPITTVRLGPVVKDELGRPSVPYTLTLQDGATLSGVLRFLLGITPKGTAEWVTGPGLDWHQGTSTQ